MTNTITSTTGSYTNDPWTVNSDVYNTNGLQYGTVSNQTVTYDPLHPNVGAQFSWNFPTEPANAILIHSYPSVTYGAGPWGVSTPLSGLTESINQQSSLDVKYNVSTHGNVAGYDVAFDIWLTSVPNGGAAAVTTEVMVWLHSGSFAPARTRHSSRRAGCCCWSCRGRRRSIPNRCCRCNCRPSFPPAGRNRRVASP